MNKSSIFRSVLILSLILSTVNSAKAQSYQATVIERVAGENAGFGTNLNDSGQIVGEAYTRDQAGIHLTNTRLAVWNRKGLNTDVSEPNSDFSLMATAINIKGVAVGQIYDPKTLRSTAFVRNPGGFEFMLEDSTNPYFSSVATDINDFNHVVGWREHEDGGPSEAFLYSADHGLFMLDGLVAYAINNKDQVLVSHGPEAWIVEPLQVDGVEPIVLDMLGAEWILPVDLNNNGVALYQVLYRVDGNLVAQSVIRDTNGKLTIIPAGEKGESVSASSINDSGAVVGQTCGGNIKAGCRSWLYSAGKVSSVTELTGLTEQGIMFNKINNNGDILAHVFNSTLTSERDILFTKKIIAPVVRGKTPKFTVQ